MRLHRKIEGTGIMTASDMSFDEKVDRFVQMLDRADCILIGAGSGLSVDAGLDYFDKELFARKYPAMLQYGYTMSAQLKVFSASSPELFRAGHRCNQHCLET